MAQEYSFQNPIDRSERTRVFAVPKGKAFGRQYDEHFAAANTLIKFTHGRLKPNNMSFLDAFLNVVKTTRARHIKNALRDPKHAIEAFKYHFRRIPERDFVRFVARQFNKTSNDVKQAYQDLHQNLECWERIEQELAVYPAGYGLQMTSELRSLYLITRLIEPNCVVETGVSSGASSAYILRALHDNGQGHLYSIDLPPDNLPADKNSGFVVSKELGSRWQLSIGDSRTLLKPLLEEIGPVDCFLHDSLHTYDHMMFEYNTVYDFIRPAGLFLSHDVGANQAFLDFMKYKRVKWRDYRVFHVLGAFCKNS